MKKSHTIDVAGVVDEGEVEDAVAEKEKIVDAVAEAVVEVFNVAVDVDVPDFIP